MALAMRGDDLSPKVRLAYGRAIGTMMTISILNPVEPGSIKKVETRKLSLGTKKKPPMNFSLPSAVSYLCTIKQINIKSREIRYSKSYDRSCSASFNE